LKLGVGPHAPLRVEETALAEFLQPIKTKRNPAA
jgi:hypothetical protein